MGARLIARESFSSFGVSYNVGDEVTPEQTKTWPEGTLQTRLENHSIEYEATEVVDGITVVDTTGTVAVAKVPFHAFGKDYNTGDPIPAEDHSTWPAGTLATRLNNGDVEFKPAEEVIPVAAAEPSAPDDEDPNDVDLTKLDAQGLVAFAKKHFNEDLDADELTDEELLEACQKLVEQSQS